MCDIDAFGLPSSPYAKWAIASVRRCKLMSRGGSFDRSGRYMRRTGCVNDIATCIGSRKIDPVVRGEGAGRVIGHALVNEHGSEAREEISDSVLRRGEAQDDFAFGLFDNVPDRRVWHHSAVERNVLGAARENCPDTDDHLQTTLDDEGYPLMRLHAEGAKPQGKNLSMAGKFTVCQLAGDTCGKIANCYVGRVCRGVVVEGGGEGREGTSDCFTSGEGLDVPRRGFPGHWAHDGHDV